jgi:signal transduction histidine kinase
MSLPQTTVELFFDSSKLEIILTNLLSNAFKYTPSGGKISLKTEIVGSSSEEAVFEGGRPSKNFLQISIQDFGVGMSAMNWIKFLTLIIKRHIPKHSKLEEQVLVCHWLNSW